MQPQFFSTREAETETQSAKIAPSFTTTPFPNPNHGCRSARRSVLPHLPLRNAIALSFSCLALFVSVFLYRRLPPFSKDYKQPTRMMFVIAYPIRNLYTNQMIRTTYKCDSLVIASSDQTLVLTRSLDAFVILAYGSIEAQIAIYPRLPPPLHFLVLSSECDRLYSGVYPSSNYGFAFARHRQQQQRREGISTTKRMLQHFTN